MKLSAMRPDVLARQTKRNHKSVFDIMLIARRLQHDPEKKKRERDQKCIHCYYVMRVRIGGAAMTTRPCALCPTEQTFASTATDALCMPCARNNDLCKQCGGDIRLRVRRTDWPSPQLDTNIVL